MPNQPPSRGFPDDMSRQSPAAPLGGADAVPDTSYVAAPEPERPKGDGHAHIAKPAVAPNATVAILIFLFVGAVLVYLFGWGR